MVCNVYVSEFICEGTLDKQVEDSRQDYAKMALKGAPAETHGNVDILNRIGVLIFLNNRDRLLTEGK